MTTRERALLAACDLAVEEGSTAVTLDRVAARAGISKGGLLYHFPSKESLMKGMLDAKLAEWEACVDAIVASGFSYPVAFVEAAFAREPDGDDRENALGAVFIAAVANDRALGEHVKNRFDRTHAGLVAAGLSPGRALLLHRAIDGIFVSCVLGAARMTQDEESALREELLSLIRPNEEALLADLFRHALREVEREG